MFVRSLVVLGLATLGHVAADVVDNHCETQLGRAHSKEDANSITDFFTVDHAENALNIFCDSSKWDYGWYKSDDGLSFQMSIGFVPADWPEGSEASNCNSSPAPTVNECKDLFRRAVNNCQTDTTDKKLGNTLFYKNDNGACFQASIAHFIANPNTPSYTPGPAHGIPTPTVISRVDL